MTATMATASVLAIIAPNMHACSQFQPNLRRSRMYSIIGTMATHVAPTTRNASVNTCVTDCWRRRGAQRCGVCVGGCGWVGGWWWGAGVGVMRERLC
jgi:hypothetical protein